MGKQSELRDRIRAVENIQRITRTLATVAAARLSRARRRAAGMREYAARFREILRHQRSDRTGSRLRLEECADLFRLRDPVRNVLLLVVSADRGMCGGYNLEVCRLATETWEGFRRAGIGVRFVTVGKRGAGYLTRRRAEMLHRESWPRRGIGASDVDRLLRLTIAEFRSGAADAVHVVYTQFHSALRHRPRTFQLLPVGLENGKGEPLVAPRPEAWHYEPGAEGLLDELVHIHLHVQLSGILLESYASEQGARMVTMEEATERANKALQEYRVQHHRLRRETITLNLLGSLFASQMAAAASRETVEHARR